MAHLLRISEHDAGAVNEQSAQVHVAAFADAKQLDAALAAANRVAPATAYPRRYCGLCMTDIGVYDMMSTVEDAHGQCCCCRIMSLVARICACERRSDGTKLIRGQAMKDGAYAFVSGGAKSNTRWWRKIE